MRLYRKAATVIAIVALCVSMSAFKACSNQSEKDRNVAFARDVASAFEQAAPIVARKNPALAAQWTTGAEKAKKLIAAFAQDDATTAIGYVRDLLPIFSQAILTIKDDSGLQVALALGQIALNFYVNHYLDVGKLKPALSRGGLGADVSFMRDVDEFKGLPQFGCQLKPDRCR